jgi:spore maturation protein CgeB
MHNKVDFITNRIFEACVAGAVIITDDNRYTREHFGDNVFYVDINKDEKENVIRGFAPCCTFAPRWM